MRRRTVSRRKVNPSAHTSARTENADTQKVHHCWQSTQKPRKWSGKSVLGAGAAKNSSTVRTSYWQCDELKMWEAPRVMLAMQANPLVYSFLPRIGWALGNVRSISTFVSVLYRRRGGSSTFVGHQALSRSQITNRSLFSLASI